MWLQVQIFLQIFALRGRSCLLLNAPTVQKRSCNHKAYKASTKRSFVSFVLALFTKICTCKKLLLALFLGEQSFALYASNYKAYKASTKRSFVSFVLALLARSAYFALAKFTCPILANRGKVLILLARSAYFALLSPNGESIKSLICSQSFSKTRTKQSFVRAFKSKQDLPLAGNRGEFNLYRPLQNSVLFGAGLACKTRICIGFDLYLYFDLGT